MTKTKRKYLAQWVRIDKTNSPYYRKCGVVMDEEHLHNGVMCCKIILGGSHIASIEHQFLTLIQM